MRNERFLLTRRTFLHGLGGATGYAALRNSPIDTLYPQSLRVAFLTVGRQSIPVLDAVFRSDRFDVVSVFAADPAVAAAVRSLSARYKRRTPKVHSHARKEIQFHPVEALIVDGLPNEQTIAVKPLIEDGKRVLFANPALVARLTPTDVLPIQHSPLVEVALLSSYDSNVRDMVETIRSGAIGNVVKIGISGNRACRWMWMEALNIAWCANAAASRDDGTSAVLPKLTISESENARLHRLAVLVRGTRGSLEIPGYLDRDRIHALSVILGSFAEPMPGQVRAPLARALDCWKLLEACRDRRPIPS